MSKTWKWILIVIATLIVIASLCCVIIGASFMIFRASDSTIETEVVATIDPLADYEEQSTPTEDPEGNSESNNQLNPATEATAPSESGTIEKAVFSDYAGIMEEAWQLANQYFVDQPLDGELLIEGAILGLREVLPVDHPLYIEFSIDNYIIASGAEGSESNPDFQKYTQPLEDVWNQAYDQATSTLNPDVMIQGAMRGMMTSLGDKHSMYLSPSELTQLSISQEGEYDGIGAWVDTSGDYITIISPMAGSPAETAGLKAGDIVIAIDGDDMTGINPDIALQRILGPAGSVIILTVEREGEPDPLDIEIIRAKITVPSVEYEMLDNDIAYLQLYQFGEHTSEDFIAALQDLEDQGAKGLILDLRGNGGGYLVTAVNVLSQFIEENTPVIYQVYGDGSEEVWNTNPGGIALDIPMVLLADGSSASASEITVGALQDLERATVIGTTTYGKGSVHYVLPLTDENGAVQVTIAKWLTPNKRYIHEVGLEPDVFIEFDEEAWENDGTDNQLEKAVEVLLDKMP
ncbi:MAG: S41 family peptidase [Anaerolineae bacterium]|jgi:carboxyl-terminal processing protease|nr:S41 family peptidase [Anaerolineae bacterium]